MLKRSDFKLRKRWQFQAVYQLGEKAVLGHVIVFSREQDSLLKCSRFGVTVTKKVGNAVVRNRVKRRFREVFYKLQPRLVPGYDFVFVARHNIVDVDFLEIYEEIKTAFKRLSKFSG